MILKRYFQQFLGYFGLRVTKLSETRAKNFATLSGMSPLTAANLLEDKSGVVITVDSFRGRGLPIYCFGIESNHPFVIAIRMATKEGVKDHRGKIDEVLAAYYETVAPRDAAQLLGLSAQSKLAEYPAWAVAMPWELLSIEERKCKVIRNQKKDNTPYDSGVRIGNGWAWIGPTDDRKRAVEVARLSHLLESILRKGYQRHDGGDGDITVDLLVDGSQWVWQARYAQHRASVLSGLGVNQFPVRVLRVIRREEVEHWPNVINGLYAVEEALYVFDNIVKGDYSYVAKDWDALSARIYKPMNTSTEENGR